MRIAAALAHRGRHELIFCIRAHPWAVQRVQSRGMDLVELPLGLAPNEELERCVREATRLGCDTAAVDLLDTPAEPDICAAFRSAGLRVLTFDDTGPGRLSAQQI